MNRRILMGLKRLMIPIPRQLWQQEVAKGAAAAARNTRFMTADHHLVRNFVVDEIARTGKALSPQAIAERLMMPLEKLAPILDELEQRMTFLFRDESGAALWAYPVTAAHTPHRMTFSDGAQIHAA